MKTQFETEKEAQAALATARCGSLGWCPLIKEDCKRKCICYYEGDIHEANPITEPKGWLVHYPSCTNVLISGVITADVQY
jgi:hypothetical protein